VDGACSACGACVCPRACVARALPRLPEVPWARGRCGRPRGPCLIRMLPAAMLSGDRMLRSYDNSSAGSARPPLPFAGCILVCSSGSQEQKLQLPGEHAREHTCGISPRRTPCPPRQRRWHAAHRQNDRRRHSTNLQKDILPAAVRAVPTAPVARR